MKQKKFTTRAFQIVANMDGIEADPDVVAARVAEENAKKESASLGYAKIDVVQLDPKFGRWNEREIVPGQVSRMVISMRGKMDRYSQENLIPIVVPKSWISGALADSSGNGADVYPTLTWSATADLNNVQAAGGQHRLSAMKIISDEYQAEIETKTIEIDKIQVKLENGSDGRAELLAEKGSLESERAALMKQMKGQRMWGVRVYDFGESTATTY
jgi:hypothetical protein